MKRLLPSLALLLLATPAALAQAGSTPRVWTDSAEFSFVLTGGNTETLSLGLKNSLDGTWERSSFRLGLAALRSEDTKESRVAVGDAGDVRVDSTKETNLTAEAYDLSARYSRRFAERHSWFLEGGWHRNEFAGVADRYTALAGLSTRWKDGDRVRFSTDEALSWTQQDDVVEDPSRSDSWLGFRFGWLLQAQAGKNGVYGNELSVDLNLDDTDDLRVDMTNSFAVSFTERLALKLSHRLLWDGQPSLEEIALFDPADLGTPIGKVPVELDSLDTVFQAALVVNF